MAHLTDLLELQKGIYGTTRDVDPATLSPIVVVHPFCVHYRGFNERFGALVHGYPAPIISFEQEDKWESTIDFVLSRREMALCEDRVQRPLAGERFFVKMKPQSPEPLETDWAGIVGFLQGFEFSHLGLVGGYTPTVDSIGCLGAIKNTLEMHDFTCRYLPWLTFNSLAGFGR